LRSEQTNGASAILPATAGAPRARQPGSGLGRLRLVVCLGLVAASAAGCRDLVQPQLAPVAPVMASGVVLSPLGVPVSGVSVSLNNYGYPGPVNGSWNGKTDEEGRFTSDLPAPGYFDGSVDFPSSSQLPGWRFYAVWFDETPKQLQPQYVSQRGRVVYAVALPFVPTNHGVEFDYGYRIPTGETRHASVSFYVSDNGEFTAWLPWAGRFRAFVNARAYPQSVAYDWPDSVVVSGADTLTLLVPVVDYEIRPSLGGVPLEAATLTVETTLRAPNKFEDGNTSLQPSTTNGHIHALGFQGSCSIRVGPPQGVPTSFLFFDRSALVTLGPGAVIAVELGRYQLGIHLRTVGGAAVVGGAIIVDSSADRGVELQSDATGSASLHLNPGAYQVLARLQSAGAAADTVVTIASDMDLTLVIPETGP
jgi:hypothetical protein